MTLDGIDSNYFKKDDTEKDDKQGKQGPLLSKTVEKEESAPKSVQKEEVINKPVKKDDTKSKPIKKEVTAKSSAKNVAVIAPMKHEPHVEKKPEEVKKVERKRITAPAKSPEKKPAVVKKRARITAPEPEKPGVEDPRPIPVVTTKEECKYWPRCKRGDECLYLHPKAPKPPAKPASIHSQATVMPPDKAKFKWTK